MLLALALLSLGCALLPAALFAANVRRYALPPAAPDGAPLPPVSVLIPARNEEPRIAAAVHAALASVGSEGEVIVLDDASTDQTAAIVEAITRTDSRVRLERAAELPPGWIGKPHACFQMAALARHPKLCFLDADVLLAPNALARLAPLLERTDLLSGVPRQITGSFSERLLIPLIHFVLLGFLPLERMRQSRAPSLGAGCGQFFLTTAEAYRQAGGHAGIRASLHDGLHLPRLFRAAGLRTDIVDLTALAECRMYEGNRATWRGLARNAHQGMGAWPVIFTMTFLLLLGQIAPWTWLAFGLRQPCSPAVVAVAAVAALSGLAIRFAAALHYRQSWLGALLHPLGVLGLLGIQWWARLRQALQLSATWKGRACS